MSSRYYIGLDPGGIGAFGWAVAHSTNSQTPTIVSTGCAPNADVAVQAAASCLSRGETPAAAGIDAPLFWTPTGTRRADATVRRELHVRGASSPGGTVQQLNSLRGACLVQGVAAALLLRRRYPRISITETHPKALLWHLGIASRDRPPASIPLDALSDLIRTSIPRLPEHERDAVLSCIAAVALDRQFANWHDLVQLEPDPLFIVPGGVAYWMPLSGSGATA